MKVAVIDPGQVAPPAVRALFSASLGAQGRLIPWPPSHVEVEQVERFDTAILVDPVDVHTSTKLSVSFDATLGHLSRMCHSCLVLTNRAEQFQRTGLAVVCIPTDSPIERVHGALLGLASCGKELARAAAERSHNQRLHESVRRHVEELDVELRLASRLQRDFLPCGKQVLGPAAFSALYRPCAWVSGDVFDIFQIDRTHVGFYLADAVGHGMAAGLLTMYVKHSLATYRAEAVMASTLLQPSQALQRLNDQIARQDLHDSPFVTCWYGVLDTVSLRMDYSSAGHPPAIWVREGVPLRELYTDGGLLGMMPGQQYETRTVKLCTKDRLVLYSDGLDNVLIRERRPLPQVPLWCDGVDALLRAPMTSLMTSLEHRLDNAPGGLNKGDDASVLVMDMRP